MGLVRDAEFGGNCHLVVFVFDLSVSLFWCSGLPWAHVLDFYLAHVRLFQTPDFCEASVFPGGGGLYFFLHA